MAPKNRAPMDDCSGWAATEGCAAVLDMVVLDMAIPLRMKPARPLFPTALPMECHAPAHYGIGACDEPAGFYYCGGQFRRSWPRALASAHFQALRARLSGISTSSKVTIW